MAQTSTYQDTEEAVECKRVEIFVLNLLLLIEALNQEVGQNHSDDPHQSVPANLNRAQVELFDVGLPNDIIEKIHHTLKRNRMTSPSFTT